VTVTTDDPFIHPPRISEGKFYDVLVQANSPWVARAGEIYDTIVAAGQDPAVWLAIAAEEHTYGTNRDSVLWRNDTRSWTNARTVRLPNLGYEIIRDPVRGSNYVRYRDVLDSVKDGLYRITDPTHVYVREGRDTIGEVFEIWTEGDGERYGKAVASRVTGWMAEDGATVAAQIPGFKWVPADSNHFDRGRGGKRIIGGAQHYSAGTNSLGHLTVSSNPPVSAHLLIKTNPTMEDRGWQLVRIEDTAWTTGEIVNPITVGVEKEHLAAQTLDDMDYAVMAQTWADVERYVIDHGLGDFSSEIKGHKTWVNQPNRICPDGIDVDRVVREWKQRRAGPRPSSQFFPETGMSVGGGFLQFWLAMGGLEIFGYPITQEVKDAAGLTVQWFERARFEHHPGSNPVHWDVLLGRLGAEAIGYDE
jgi:hypothetical protein